MREDTLRYKNKYMKTQQDISELYCVLYVTRPVARGNPDMESGEKKAALELSNALERCLHIAEQLIKDNLYYVKTNNNLRSKLKEVKDVQSK